MTGERKYSVDVPLTEEQANIVEGHEAELEPFVAALLAAEWERMLGEYARELARGKRP